MTTEINNINYRSKIETAHRNSNTSLTNLDILMNTVKKAKEEFSPDNDDLLGYCFYSHIIKLEDFKSKFGDDGPFWKHVITSNSDEKKSKLKNDTPVMECLVWTPELCGMLPLPEKLIPVKEIISNTAGREEADEVLEAIADIVKKLAPKYVKKPKVRSMDQGPNASKYIKKVQGLEKDLRKIAMLPRYYKLNKSLETIPFGQMVQVKNSDDWTPEYSWYAGSLEQVLPKSWDFSTEKANNPGGLDLAIDVSGYA